MSKNLRGGVHKYSISQILKIVSASILIFFAVSCKPNVEHEHTFATEWTTDETYHWHAATCEHIEEVSEKAEHAFDEGKVTLEPTDVKDGEKTFTCTVCYETKTEVIPATGHVWDEYIYDNNATEEQVGTKTANCKHCEATDVLPANGPNTATYQFTETIQPAPEGYSGSMESAGKTGRYVIFGDFPQTIAKSGVEFNPRPEENGYYVGSDGCYYEKVLENAYTGNNTKNYSDNTTPKRSTENSYRYFKVEPIVWRIVTTTYDIDGTDGDATGALLFAENTLIATKYFDSKSSRTITGTNGTTTTIDATNYENSTIRAYLNGLSYYQTTDNQVDTYKESGFLQKAFTPDAINAINTTYLIMDTDTAGGDVGNNTRDKIFLLSTTERKISDYDFTKDTSCRVSTDYSVATGSDKGGWWTRTRYSTNSSSVVIVDFTGGQAAQDANLSYYSIVPALTVPVSELPQ